MAFLERDGVRLHWQEDGAGSPILLIMGATYSGEMWYPAIATLAAHHRVLWFDNRGTGQSQASQVASIRDMADDAVAILDAAGAPAAHVYGISLGGIVAIELALQYPDRVSSLVLGCTGILSRAKPRAPKAWDARFQLPKEETIPAGNDALYGPAAAPDRVARDVEMRWADETDIVGLVAQQDALRAYSVEADEVATLTSPSLVLHGTVDPVVPTEWGEELARTLPNSRWRTYEGAGHNYLVAAGDQSNADVLAFLAEVDGGGSVAQGVQL